MKSAKDIFKKIARQIGFEFLSTEVLKNIRKEEIEMTSVIERMKFMLHHGALNKDLDLGIFFEFQAKKFKQSNGQLFQDIFVLHVLKEKQEGFFVEFGATDGKSLSNTLMLEKHYNWRGILAEPAKIWHHDLFENRTCHIDKRCVWKVSGEVLTFQETVSPELSTLANFSKSDFHASRRDKNKIYTAETVSLEDLLMQYNAPTEIDYLSIDTEGSEYTILKDFDFDKYFFKVITIEHNYTSQREPIQTLLETQGYQRVFENFSFFDDWYIHNSLKK